MFGDDILMGIWFVLLSLVLLKWLLFDNIWFKILVVNVFFLKKKLMYGFIVIIFLKLLLLIFLMMLLVIIWGVLCNVLVKVKVGKVKFFCLDVFGCLILFRIVFCVKFGSVGVKVVVMSCL